MSGTSITGDYPNGITLTSLTDTNPVSIASGANIGSASGPALQASASAVWTITNSGTVIGASAGVSLASIGNVVNAGAIADTQITGSGFTYSGGILTPLSGAVLSDGGMVTNLIGGRIDGGFFGVALSGSGSVANQGSIVASGTTFGAGVALAGGGYFGNAVSGGISGASYGLLVAGSSDSTLVNAGLIQSSANGVRTLGTVAATLTNTGSIGGGSHGVDLGGGTLDNAAGGTISGGYGGAFVGNAGTLSNSGDILSTGGASGVGAAVLGAGVAVNWAGGSITSGDIGLAMTGAGTITNLGSIASTLPQSGSNDPSGIDMSAGGNVTNAAGARVTAEWKGVAIGTIGSALGGTLVNSGYVFAGNSAGNAGAAVWIHGAGLIDNTATGTIEGGPYGVVAYFDTTIVNQGTIGGTEFSIFQSNATATNRVEAAPGAVFAGLVEGGSNTASAALGTLELLAGRSAGSITGFGSQFVQFGDVALDAHGSWSLAGSITSGQTVSFGGGGIDLTLANPTAAAGTFANFVGTDTMVLGGISGVTSAVVNASELLTISTASGPALTLQLDAARHDAAGTSLTFSGSGGNTELFACFAAGTAIATDQGEVPVEALQPGMCVASPFGGSNPVVWIGHRDTDCRHHSRPHDVWPVRIAAGAFGPGRPARALWLSPDHAVFAGGVLVPVRYLLNGRTIAQEPRDRVTYYHVELPRHDVLLAEGLACESYLDTGNRAAFANGGPAIQMHPDFALRVWQAQACAQLVREGGRLADTKRQLLARASELGHATTVDPGLIVMAGGRPMPAQVSGRRWRLRAPGGSLRLASQCWVPAHMQPDTNDTRRLGVAIGELLLNGAPLALDDPRLIDGWHAPEFDMRWTDGDAGLDLPRGSRLEFSVVTTGQYWQRSATPHQQRA